MLASYSGMRERSSQPPASYGVLFLSRKMRVWLVSIGLGHMTSWHGPELDVGRWAAAHAFGSTNSEGRQKTLPSSRMPRLMDRSPVGEYSS